MPFIALRDFSGSGIGEGMQTVMPKPTSFYVTAVDGPRVHFLAGPFDTLEEAEQIVEPVRKLATDPDRNASFGRAWFMAYGVTRGPYDIKTRLGKTVS